MQRLDGATGVEVNKLKDTLVEQTASLAGETTFSDLAAKETGREADDATLPDGATVTWVVVPTSFITETGGKKARNNQSLLGLREDDKWYFLRIDGPERQQMATIAYPFLKDVSIPGAVVTPIE